MGVPYILVHGMHAVMTRGVLVIEYNKGLWGMAHKGGDGRAVTTRAD